MFACLRLKVFRRMRNSPDSLDLYNLEQKIFLVRNYYQELGSYTCVEYNYEDHFKPSVKGHPVFSKNILTELIKLFERTGSVSSPNHSQTPRDIKGDSGNWLFSAESPFKCELCEKCFLNFTNLKRHVLQSHNLNDIYKCDFCSMDFRKKYKFLRHMRNHEEISTGQRQKTPMFKQCDDCGKFCSVATFEEHRKSHSSEAPLKCSICGQEFTWTNGYKLHMMSHRGIVINPLACKICGRKMAGEKTLKMHMEQAHRGTAEPVVPEPEGMEVKNEVDVPEAAPKEEDNSMDNFDDLIIQDSDSSDGLPGTDDQFFAEFNTATPQSDMRRPYMINPADEIGLCEQCGKVLCSKRSLYNHMKTHTTDLPYKCNIDGCYREYRWPKSLEFHVITAHDKNRGRNIKCSLCGKGFVYPYHLRAHMRTDHSENIFSCAYCSDVFSERDQLDAHLQDWHNVIDGNPETSSPIMVERRITRLKPVSCVICGKSFPYKYMLKKHMPTHAKAKEDLECPIPGCGKTFHIDKNLKMHIATHKVRSYKCADCDCSYKNFRALKRHIKRYHLKVDPPFKCKICPFNSWYQRSLEGHMRRHAKFGQI